MTLYWPANANQIDLSAPGLHALIIGVGDYPHLMGGTGPQAAITAGLKQLTTTHITAIRMAEWLSSSYKNSSCPIGSIELLLSPAEQITRADGSNVAIEVSSMTNVRKAFNRWYKRCNKKKENIAFFYFAGHGISTAAQYLLPADFMNPKLNDRWTNCIDFDGMRVGMKANNADTQLFFIDACREQEIDLLTQLNPHGNPLCSADLFDQVSASAAYYAAADGRKAYGPDDEITYFCKAVLETLAGAGATRQGTDWVVDTFSLGNSIGQLMTSYARAENIPLSCNPDPDGTLATIHFPTAAHVNVSIRCLSKEANDESEIRLQRQATSFHSPSGDPRPWKGKLAPGDWDYNITFKNFPNISRTETLMGAVIDLEEKL